MLSGIVRAASVPGRSEYLNIKEESEAYFAHKFEGLLEILFAFAVKTCEQVGAYAAVGNAAAYCGYAVEGTIRACTCGSWL